jgi:hypothetical protein
MVRKGPPKGALSESPCLHLDREWCYIQRDITICTGHPAYQVASPRNGAVAGERTSSCHWRYHGQAHVIDRLVFAIWSKDPETY